LYRTRVAGPVVMIRYTNLWRISTPAICRLELIIFGTLSCG
jgi:hypothetical protein